MKSPFKSKTLIFNIIAAAVIVAGMVGYDQFTPDESFIALVVAVGNFALRFVTKEPIGTDG